MPDARQAHKVLLTAGAKQDLASIYRYISDFDSMRNANMVLDRLTKVAAGLSTLADHGAFPKELVALGIRRYRQTAFKSYRIIYRVIDDTVVIYLIADGRRNMQALLARRLLNADR